MLHMEGKYCTERTKLCHTVGARTAIKKQFAVTSTSPNVAAMIDCTHIKLRSPKDDELVSRI